MDPNAKPRTTDLFKRFQLCFSSEVDLHHQLATLLTKIPSVTGVQVTHGTGELGKDLVFYAPGPFGERRLHACVVKKGRITGSAGSSNSAMTALHQVEQALLNAYISPTGEREKVAAVYVITPQDVSQSTMQSIEGSLKAKSGQVIFCCGRQLLDLFKRNWPEFLLFESEMLTAYAAHVRSSMERDDPVSILATEHPVIGDPGSLWKTYVRQHFEQTVVCHQSEVRVPELSAFSGLIGFAEASTTADELRHLSALVNLPLLGSGREGAVPELATRLNSMATRLVERWEKSYQRSYRQGLGLPRDASYVPVAWASSVLKRVRADLEAAQSRVQALDAKIKIANEFATATSDRGGLTFSDLWSRDYLAYCEVCEIERDLPEVVSAIEPRKTLYLGNDVLRHLNRSVLVTGSAGFGKTSFCKWNTLADIMSLRDRTGGVLPVYVPLHRLAARHLGTYSEEFFATSELRALTQDKSSMQSGPWRRIRLYLDGLDEISRVQRQREVVELALDALRSDPRIEVVVTGRNYVSGPWLGTMPRVQISEFSEDQVREFVLKSLGDADASVAFFDELQKVPALRQLMVVPLLARLVLGVYRNRRMTSLPASRVRLYEISIELMAGGWDAAKNVRRNTHFGEAVKLAVLTRLASQLHDGKRRQARAEDIKQAVSVTIKRMESKGRLMREELIQDGLLVKAGGSYAFAHVSFQEFLAAKDLTDPSGKRQERVLREFLCGDDWWQEVLTFYIGLTGRPEELEHWVIRNSKDLVKRRQIGTDGLRRCEYLVRCIDESFPGYQSSRGKLLEVFAGASAAPPK